MSDQANEFFRELINDYVRSRPNAKKHDPKRVAKRLGVKKREFEGFLNAWMSVFGTLSPVKNESSKRREEVPTESDRPRGDRSHSDRRDATPPDSSTGANRLSGFIKKVGMRGGVFIPHGGGSPEVRAAGGPVEVQIAPEDMKDAQAGDEVVIKLSSRRSDEKKLYGRVIEVLQRATNSFVGTYDEFEDQGYVKIDGRNFTDPIWVGDPGAKGAAPGDKVVIEMLRFPTHAQGGEGVLTQVLGAKGEPGVDLQTILHEYGLPDEFPIEVLHDATKQAERFDESDLRGRLDLTQETIVTIDPHDARDFDDAISLSKNEAGHWVLGVHIADVSHFVQSGSQLDREAKRRGTSVYLPTRVLPMLPEVISNGLASLQQGRVRYTNTAFIEFTPDGIPVHTEFAKSAIKVVQRFAYEEVMPIVESVGNNDTNPTELASVETGLCTTTAEHLVVQKPKNHRGKLGGGGDVLNRAAPDARLKKVTVKVRKLLCDMHELAMTLRRRRFEHGSLDLNIPEVKLDFDKDGRVIGAHEANHDESHQMIEEFMLAANIAVATKLNDMETPFLRRVHAEPDSLKLQSFAKFITTLGFELDVQQAPQKGKAKSKDRSPRTRSRPSAYDSPVIISKAALQTLLKQVRGTPAERAINFALLRSMKQASYSGVPIGHYALSVSEYCHFTSPIRRYPDLTIHRLFDEFTAKGSARGMGEAELEILGTHCSDTERRAAQAERELTKLKLLALMAGKVGEEFDAIVTGVERFGMFCQGLEMPVDGFVHVSAISENDYFNYDPDSLSLVGRSSGRQFRLGDRVRVQIAHVNEQRRELDFRVILDKPPARRPRGPQEAAPEQRQRTSRRPKSQNSPRKPKRR